MRSLKELRCVPRFVHNGHIEGKDFVVMELFGGEDMAKLRNRLRTQSEGKSNAISLQAAIHLSKEILRLLKHIHSAGYVHRDVKPSNFVRENWDSHTFRIIDFGVSKRFKDKDGRIIPKRETAEFRGTTSYASVNSHNLEDLGPRDDLWSMFYIFVDLLCGSLPWTEAAKHRDKEMVADLKRDYFSNPHKIISWISEHRVDVDFSGAPTERCLALMSYLNILKYEDTPDYSLIDGHLCGMVKGFLCPMSELDFRGGENMLRETYWESSEANSTKQRQKRLCCKAKLLGRLYSSALNTSAENIPTPDHEHMFGKIVHEKDTLVLTQKFADLCKSLVAMKEHEVLQSSSDTFWNILINSSRFFSCDLGNMDDKWPEFVEAQVCAIPHISNIIVHIHM